MLKYHTPRWMIAYNSSGLIVPANGLVEVTEADYDPINADGPTLQLKVDRPTSDSAANIAINSWMPIPVGSTGLVTFDGPVLVDATGATFSAGGMLGSAEDSFIATEDQSGLVMLADMGDGSFLVDKAGGGGLKPKCLFYLSNDLTTSESSESATIEVQYGQGADHASLSITVLNMKTHTGGVYEFHGDAGDYGIASYTGVTGVWRIDIMECP